jgi:hypothetical protein
VIIHAHLHEAKAVGVAYGLNLININIQRHNNRVVIRSCRVFFEQFTICSRKEIRWRRGEISALELFSIKTHYTSLINNRTCKDNISGDDSIKFHTPFEIFSFHQRRLFLGSGKYGRGGKKLYI